MLEQHFIRALDTAKKQGSKGWELRATISILRLHAPDGRRTEASETLGRLYRSFTEGFDTPDLREANTLLAELRSVE